MGKDGWVPQVTIWDPKSRLDICLSFKGNGVYSTAQAEYHLRSTEPLPTASLLWLAWLSVYQPSLSTITLDEISCFIWVSSSWRKKLSHTQQRYWGRVETPQHHNLETANCNKVGTAHAPPSRLDRQSRRIQWLIIPKLLRKAVDRAGPPFPCPFPSTGYQT